MRAYMVNGDAGEWVIGYYTENPRTWIQESGPYATWIEARRECDKLNGITTKWSEASK